VTASSIYLPRILRIGAGVSSQLAEVLLEMGLSSPMIVSDPFMAQCGYVDKIASGLEKSNVEFGTFTVLPIRQQTLLPQQWKVGSKANSIQWWH
jgi:alcohol dehydrogenase class IV